MTPRQLRSWSAALSAVLVAACGGGGGGGRDASAAGALDKLAPTVTYAAPSNNATGIGTNTKLTITFSEPMDEDSLGKAIRLVDDDSSTPVPLQNAVFDAENNIATVAAQSPLTPGRRHCATVSTSARDLAGNALAQAYNWCFVTAAGADAMAPTVASFTPADGATNVPINRAVAMSFSEPMDAASVDAAFSLKSAGRTPVAGSLAYIGQAAVFTPQAPLAPNTTYVATLGHGAKDLAGNEMAADRQWSFTTGAGADATPPTVLGVSPPNGAQGVPGNTILTVNFSEPVYPFTFGKIDGKVVDVAIDYTTQTVSLIPTGGLGANKIYQSSMQAIDLAGNAMPAPYNWSFTTAP